MSLAVDLRASDIHPADDSNRMVATSGRAMSIFRFEPRWKEEVVCTAPGGSLVLELPVGVLTACLPTDEEWRKRAPAWARGLWRELKGELEARCEANDAQFIIDPTATVY